VPARQRDRREGRPVASPCVFTTTLPRVSKLGRILLSCRPSFTSSRSFCCTSGVELAESPSLPDCRLTIASRTWAVRRSGRIDRCGYTARTRNSLCTGPCLVTQSHQESQMGAHPPVTLPSRSLLTFLTFYPLPVSRPLLNSTFFGRQVVCDNI
jgi:hypothetical protein